MADNFNVIISTSADTRGFKSDINKLNKAFENESIELKVSTDFAKASIEAQKEIQKLAKKLQSDLAKQKIQITDEESITLVKRQIKETDKLATSMAKVREQAELKAKQSVNNSDLAQTKASNKALEKDYQDNLKLAEAMGKVREQAELKSKTDKSKSELSQVKAVNMALEDKKLTVQQINTLMSNSGINTSVSNATTQYSKLSNVTTELKTDFQQLSVLQTALGNSTTDEELISNYEKFNTTLQKVVNQTKILNNQQGLSTSNKKLADSMEVVTTKSLAAGKSFQSYAKTLNSAGLKDSANDISRISNEFDNAAKSGKQIDLTKANASMNEFKSNMKLAGNETKSFMGTLGNDIQKFAQWTISATALMTAINGIKSAVSTVYNMDQSLTDLRMVTGGSIAETQELINSYNDLAQQLGATTQEVVTSGNEWLNKIGQLCRNI